MVKVICVIVLYNPKIENILKQLYILSKQVSNIMFVDNSSNSNQKIKKTAEQYSGHYITNYKNVGIAAAQNQGIQWALSKKCTHVLIMDQDSLLGANSITKLLATEQQLLNNNKLGAIGPVYEDVRKKINLMQKISMRK